jgi:hypothetical protein
MGREEGIKSDCDVQILTEFFRFFLAHCQWKKKNAKKVCLLALCVRYRIVTQQSVNMFQFCIQSNSNRHFTSRPATFVYACTWSVNTQIQSKPLITTLVLCDTSYITSDILWYVAAKNKTQSVPSTPSSVSFIDKWQLIFTLRHLRTLTTVGVISIELYTGRSCMTVLLIVTTDTASKIRI